ncbi:MAG TPA: pyridoxal-phosphate dependent enzyme [Solirubrobacteraceae bacterium]|nr:pyridoxal-phosphate dependent enzyme [Solirubrobacteraceae bacterium]
MRLAIGLADVESAAERLAGVAHRTPTLTSRTLDDRLGASLWLKAESFQRMGAFKFRGAYNCISRLPAEQLARGIVAASSGNHAQAVALAASICASRALILMPRDAPAGKRAATEGYGGRVVEFDRYADDRDALTREIADREGLTIVHPYDDPHVMAGAGTVALELVQDAGELDVLVVPVGGGGLISGCAVAAKALLPDLRLVGVEPEASDDTRRSLAAGRRVRVAVGATLADGMQRPTPGELTFAVSSRLVDDVVTVTDAEIVAAMRFFFERMKIVVEPSGAATLAAVLAGRIDVRGGRAGLVISGGNVDASRFASICAGAPRVA